MENFRKTFASKWKASVIEKRVIVVPPKTTFVASCLTICRANGGGTVSMLVIYFCHKLLRPNQLKYVMQRLKYKGASSDIVVYSLPMKPRTIVN